MHCVNAEFNASAFPVSRSQIPDIRKKLRCDLNLLEVVYNPRLWTPRARDVNDIFNVLL